MTRITADIDEQHETISWLRSVATIDALPDPLSPDGRRLAEGAARLLNRSPLPEPVLVTVPARHAASLLAARDEALAALQAHGLRDADKLNAGVGPAGAALVEDADIPALVRDVCGLQVAAPTTATYVGYLEPGQRLELHLDLHGFGDLVFLLCLAHDPVPVDGSQTVLVTSSGQLRFGMRHGEALLFDGARTPHGRTQVSGSERVVSIALGLTLLNS